MKTKNIFKALAFAMLMPAMMLTTACSSDDSIINTPEKTENTTGKVYEIPITINATRQGDDATTRATYNPDTRKLEYSEGDQLYVIGNHETAGMYGGALEWKGGIIFSGTITTPNLYEGSGVELLSDSKWARAILLPAGYDNYHYITINNPGFSGHPDATFATSKATAIEQFSNESARGYNNGFALAPQNAILNFTLTGLTPNTEINVKLWNSYYSLVEGNVTTNGSGTATFAIGIDISMCKAPATTVDVHDLYNTGWELRVNGEVMPPLVTSSTPLEPGHIYNITRSVAGGGDEAYTMAASATGEDVGKLICTDGHIHAYGADPECTATRVALIAYVGAESNCTHGLAIALEDVSNEGLTWELTGINNDDKTAAEWCSAWNTSSKAVTGYTWRLPSQEDWQYMFIGCGSGESYANPSDWLKRSYNDLATNLDNVDGTALHNNNDLYWSSTTKDSGQAAWCVMFNNNGAFFIPDAVNQGFSHYVRSCLAF